MSFLPSRDNKRCSKKSTTAWSIMNTPALLEEYKMLRNDIHQRIHFRFQIFNLLLVALGGILSLGLEKGNPKILLVYPVLSFFLAMNWIHQGVVIVKLARYLRDELEPKIPGMAWEAYIKRDSTRFSGFSVIGFFATIGFVIFSQALTLVLAFSIEPDAKWGGLTIFLAVLGCLVTVLTLYFLVVFSRMKR